MTRLLWSSLLATTCLCLLVVVSGQQRRRERRPVERLLVAGTSSKPLFSAREEEQPLVGKGFMPDFGWSGPDWNDGTEWGFKESKRVVTERSEALFEGREYLEQPVVEAREYVEPLRRSRPRWRFEGGGGGQAGRHCGRGAQAGQGTSPCHCLLGEPAASGLNKNNQLLGGLRMLKIIANKHF